MLIEINSDESVSVVLFETKGRGTVEHLQILKPGSREVVLELRAPAILLNEGRQTQVVRDLQSG